MVSVKDNETLTMVGPDTPMGELMRRYWQPVALSWELPEPDCPPVRVRIRGEDLDRERGGEGTGALGPTWQWLLTGK